MHGIFFESASSEARKLAIFEDNGSSAWLYLASASSHEVEKDAFVYSPVSPRDGLNREGMQQGEPPILTKDVASEQAQLTIEDENDLSIVWSANGRSLAVFYGDRVLAAIYEDEAQGYSKALGKRCGFGRPWSAEKFMQFFPDYE